MEIEYIIYEKNRRGLDFCTTVKSIKDVKWWINALICDEPILEVHEINSETGERIVKSAADYYLSKDSQTKQSSFAEKVNSIRQKELDDFNLSFVRPEWCLYCSDTGEIYRIEAKSGQESTIPCVCGVEIHRSCPTKNPRKTKTYANEFPSPAMKREI